MRDFIGGGGGTLLRYLLIEHENRGTFGDIDGEVSWKARAKEVGDDGTRRTRDVDPRL